MGVFRKRFYTDNVATNPKVIVAILSSTPLEFFFHNSRLIRRIRENEDYEKFIDLTRG